MTTIRQPQTSGGLREPGSAPCVAEDSIELLSAWLRDNSDRIEAARRIPDDVVVRLKAAGLFRMTLPPRLGGQGRHPADVWPIVLRLARGSGSAAWLVSLCLANTIMLARLPDHLQQELFGGDRDIIVAALTGAAPRGLQVEKVDGGVVVSGRWGYASGVDVADWVGLILPAGPMNDPSFVLLPQAEFHVDHASWNVLGMRGTGSKDVALKSTFVPAGRMVDWKLLQEGRRHPACSSNDELDQYPLNGLFAMSILAPTLGVTYALVDEFQSMAEGRVASAGRDSRDPWLASELALARATIGMACDSLLVEAARPTVEGWTSAGTTVEMRAAMRARISVIADTARTVSQRLLRAAGGQIMPAGSRYEMLLRDLAAMNSHLLLQIQPVSENYGRLILGQGLLPGSRI